MRARRAPTAEAGGLCPADPVGALLDELEVIVGEPPEEPFGDIERLRMLVRVERHSVAGIDRSSGSDASIARSRGSVTLVLSARLHPQARTSTR